jgi:hypothetical protein
MPNANPRSSHIFARHVAPFAPLALALAMNTAPTKPTPSTSSLPSSHRASRSGGGGGGSFVLPASCSLPFNGTENPDIDTRCPINGGGSSAAKQAQSRAKNNLCAGIGQPLRITYQDFIAKQKKADSLNVTNLLDRSPLTALGEGAYVEYVAFIQDAHYSDVSSGEAVNCNIPGDSTNDIHIVLVQDPNDDPCTSTTAEMIPHFRPAAWTDTNVDSVKDRPVRVRGPLFYDDAHKPCSGTSRPSPNRVSVWEIHPVYSLDVCRQSDLAQCENSTDSADWISLEDWLKQTQ